MSASFLSTSSASSSPAILHDLLLRSGLPEASIAPADPLQANDPGKRLRSTGYTMMWHVIPPPDGRKAARCGEGCGQVEIEFLPDDEDPVVYHVRRAEGGPVTTASWQCRLKKCGQYREDDSRDKLL